MHVNFPRIRERSPKLLVIDVGTLNITALNVHRKYKKYSSDACGKMGHLKKVFSFQGVQGCQVHRDY